MKLGERQDTMREFPLIKAATQRALLQIIATDQTLREDVFHTCLSCFNWEDKEEICMLYKQRPPARIIANGCPSYEDIPF
jgi:hypothetical protein